MECKCDYDIKWGLIMIITMRRIETNQNGNVNGNIMGYLMRSFIINMGYINDRDFNFNILQTGSFPW